MKRWWVGGVPSFLHYSYHTINRKKIKNKKDESLLIFSVDNLLTVGAVVSTRSCAGVPFFVLNLSSGLCCDGYGTEKIRLHYILDI